MNQHFAAPGKGKNGSLPETYGLLGQSMAGVLKEIEDRKARGGRIAGLSTGFPRLDDLIDGLRPSTMTVIGARPKQGKTGLALCIGRNLCLNGKKIAFFSMEMPRDELVKRMLSIHSGIPYKLIQRGLYSEADHYEIVEAAMQIERWQFIVDDAPALTPSALGERARIAKDQGAEVIFIDYLQLMTADGRTSSEYEQVSAVSNAVAALRKTLNLPIVALVQLSRNVVNRAITPDWKKFNAESSRPTDADIRGSGKVEQDADVVAFLNRPEVYLQQAKPSDGDDNMDYQTALSKWRGRGEIFVQHNRAGESGFVDLRFNGPLMKFDELR